MTQQQELITTHFNRSDLVQVHLQFDWGGEVFPGQVEAECSGRPGWYYVRDCDSGEVHLVRYSELLKT